MATKLYFHAAASGVSGTLPSAEQSTLTSAANADAQTVNRSMNTTIGTSQATLNIAATSSTRDLYYTKFVSPIIYQTSVAANTWTYAFTAMESSLNINFPVSSTNKSVYVNAYVWKPSNGTKYGTILDGNTALTVDEGTANGQIYHIVTFTGAGVSSLTSGDAVIVIEIWFRITSTTTGSQTFYYDGTTEYAENGTSTSAASYLSTPEDLVFTQNVARTLSTETVSISENVLALQPARAVPYLGNDTLFTSTANTTYYFRAGGGRNYSTTEANTQTKVRHNTTYEKLTIQLFGNTIPGISTFRSRVNSANGSQQISIPASTNGYFTDSSGVDNCVPDDLFNFQFVPGAATGVITQFMLGCLQKEAAYTTTRLSLTSRGAATGPTITTASTTRYWPISGAHSGAGNGNGTESNAAIPIRKNGILQDYQLQVTTNARTTTTTLGTRKNSAVGNQSVSVVAAATGYFEDNANKDYVAVDDTVNYYHTTGTGTETLTFVLQSVLYKTPNQHGLVTFASSLGYTVGTGTTAYYRIAGEPAGTTTEGNAVCKSMASFRYSNMTIQLFTNNYSGSTTLQFRKSFADGNQILSIASAATGIFHDSTNTDDVAADDFVAYKIVVGAGTNSTMVFMSMHTKGIAAAQNIVKTLTTETINISEATFARLAAKIRTASDTTTRNESIIRLAAKIRTRTDTAITLGETRARLSSKLRTIATQTTALSENVIRIKGKVKSLAAETITVSGGTLARLLAKIRAASDTTATAETRNRLAAKNKALATQSTTLSESTIRIKGMIKSLAAETVIVGAGIAVRLSAKIRAMVLQTVALTDNRTRLKGGVRTIATQTVSLSENIARTVARQVIRALTIQTVTLGESIARLKASQRITPQTITTGENAARLSTKLRAIATQTIILSESRTRIKAAVKIISQTIVLTDNRARLATKLRALSTQTVALADSVTRTIIGGAVEITRTLTQTVVLSETVGRRLAAQRILIQTVPKAESLARVRGVLKSLLQTILLSESRSRIKSTSRTLSQTVLSSDSITKQMTKIRAITQTTILASSVAAETVGNLVRSLVETVTASDSIARRLTKQRILAQTTVITEQAGRLSTKLRTIPAQTIILSDSVVQELNVIIKHAIKTLSQLIAITDYAKIEVVKKSQRFRKILDPSIKRLKSNHPAWFLGSRGMHDHYEEFAP